MTPAHIAGLPVEETLGSFSPALLLAFGAASGRVRGSGVMKVMLRRVLAILVLVLVALLAIRVVVGLVVGVVSAVLWIAVLVALVGAGVWAWSTLAAAGHRRRVKQQSSPATELTPAAHEDRVAAEMRRITEQLRQQGRR